MGEEEEIVYEPAYHSPFLPNGYIPRYFLFI
jgi:hypothetical protein